MAYVWGAVACDGLNSPKPGREPVTDQPRAPGPAQRPPSGPDAPATITQKRWLEIQLIAERSTLPLRGLDNDSESISTSVDRDAIAVDYRRNRLRAPDLESDRWRAASDACWLLSGIDIPDWATELHLEVSSIGGLGNLEVRFTRTRVAVSSLDRRGCSTMVGLNWSPPTPTEWQAPPFSDLPLSVARQDGAPSAAPKDTP
jgi:hypothetical protein